MDVEYIRAVLVQIPATRIDEASRPQGLLAELEEHRSFLQQQPGFQGVRVTRSFNPEGDVLLVVETRWQDESSLAEYGAREPNVTSIISKYRDLTVAGSLQVSDMEALDGAPRPAPTEVSERLALPLLIPLGAFFFSVLVIFGLSRIYLEVPNEVATPLALGIAIGILGVSWYLASNPQVPRWQIGSIVVVAVALLLGGGIFAAVHEEEEGAAAAVSPSPEAPAGAGAALSIAMIPSIKFDKTELTIAANEDVAVEVDNRDGNTPHNFAVYTSREAAESGEAALGATPICNAPCKDTVTLNLPPGEYFFRCDVHPTQMVGTLTVEEGAAAPAEAAAGGGAVLSISALKIAFDTDVLEAPADEPFVIEFENQEPVPHNVAIYTDDSATELLFLGEIFSGPDSRTYEVPPLEAGEYFFRCDVHPSQMTGTLVVQQGSGGTS